MNFFDIVAEKGYAAIKEDNPNIIHLVKDDGGEEPLVEAHIVFHKKEKLIKGFLKPKDLIFDVNDMAIMYRVFRNMQEDLNFFADRSHYDII